jgi:hypothetical protein
VIFCFLELGGIDDHCCLELVACFLDIGGIDDHYCLEVIVRFVKLLQTAMVINSIKINKTNNHL